jgi:hypothetical protein
MKSTDRRENAEAVREAIDAATKRGTSDRGAAGVAALKRYLAAEAFHERNLKRPGAQDLPPEGKASPTSGDAGSGSVPE